MNTKRGAARPRIGTAPSDAASRLHVESHSNDATDSSRRLLRGLTAYVTGGRDRTPLDRLTTAARHGRELVENGADRVTVVAALTLAAEAAGLPRRRVEDVLRDVLRGPR